MNWLKNYPALSFTILYIDIEKEKDKELSSSLLSTLYIDIEKELSSSFLYYSLYRYRKRKG
jgi:hypothetical protein